jgi:2-keto-4-pentenoate hydratase/2-oxohepta-3-ene-1,7-dioic acid hydratase in catechol pathway
MRLVSFSDAGAGRLGVLHGDTVTDLGTVASNAPSDLATVLRGGPEVLRAIEKAAASAPARAVKELGGLKLLPPLVAPGKIVCLGLNYADHAAEGGHTRPDYPSLFLRCSSSLVAHGSPIVRPRCSEQLDYEAELVAVIGRRARHVKAADALAYVAGYSCFNDASVRNYQRKTAQWTIGKNFDATGAFGPAFVTADELPPGAAGLRIVSRLNGKVMQDATTADMLFPVAETIELLTECMTLMPGDVLVMGTPAGVGHARKPPVWMKDGDTVEIEIEQIGLLRNPIVDEPPMNQ